MTAWSFRKRSSPRAASVDNARVVNGFFFATPKKMPKSVKPGWYSSMLYIYIYIYIYLSYIYNIYNVYGLNIIVTVARNGVFSKEHFY